jgi:HSP20 family protein
MALPVRIHRGHTDDSFDLARQDFGTMLSRLLGGGMSGDGGDSPLAPLASFGVDIREDENHVYIEADLPGVRKEDVDISLEDGTLTIVAERREEITEPAPAPGERQAAQGTEAAGAQQGQQREGQQDQQTQQGRQGKQGQQGQWAQQGRSGGQPSYLLRERRIQRFVRSFTLPPNVDDQNVQARLEDGVLKITLNKREESKPKRVQIS